MSSSPELLSLLDGMEIQTSASAGLSVYSNTADKAYDNLMMMRNVTSYSQLQLLHTCPRKYQLAMHAAAGKSELLEDGVVNVDFTYGHAVGAGVQSYLRDKDLTKASFNAMMAWRAPFEERVAKKKKSLWEAIIAIEQFAHWWSNTSLGEEFELAYLPNGKPAIELSFSLHFPDGYRYYGHIDLVLRSKFTGKYAVLELKTTAAGADEAQYANSNQATGYALMLPHVWPGIQDYTVYYCVYETKSSEWSIMPFFKSKMSRAEWIKDVMLDHSAIATYESIGFYPKRGESCFSFMRRCQFFGECNMVPEGQLPWLEEGKEAEAVDAVIDLQDVIDELKAAKARQGEGNGPEIDG